MINQLDAFSEVGANTSLIKTQNVMIDNGLLEIKLIHQVENPKISGIEVISVDG